MNSVPTSRATAAEKGATRMRKPISHAWIVAALVAIACSLAASAGAQTRANGEAVITGFSPKQAMAGQVVTFSGMNLDGTRSVTFGSTPATSIAVDSTQGLWVRAVVPTGITPGTVTVTFDNGQNPVSISGFQVLAGSVP